MNGHALALLELFARDPEADYQRQRRHVAALLQSALRADGTHPTVRALDTDAMIAAAAGACMDPMGVWHLIGPWDDQCGVWSFARGQRIPGTADVLGQARCSRCGACRDAVITAKGTLLGGPEFRPMGEPT